jgi:hypothetical protein
VQIIDSCPSASAWNYCKTEVQANERCGSRSTNALDIDLRAYRALTGEDKTSVSVLSLSPIFLTEDVRADGGIGFTEFGYFD